MPLELTPTSAVQTLNQTLAGNQIAARPYVQGGQFAVVWQSNEAAGTDLMLRGLDVTGTPLGLEQRYLGGDGRDQLSPEVAILAGGEIALIWGQAHFEGQEVHAVLVPGGGSAAMPLGGSQAPVKLLDLGPDDYRDPTITALAGGGFAVTADLTVGNGEEPDAVTGILRLFDADGMALGPARELYEGPGLFDGLAALARMDNGTLLALTTVVTDLGSEPGSEPDVDVFARFFNGATGMPLGPSANLSGEVLAGQADLIRLADGRLLGAAEVIDPETGDLSLVISSFDATGVPQRDVSTVNDRIVTEEQEIALAATADGGFVAAWEVYEAGEGARVVIRRFDVDLQPLGESAFVTDGSASAFETNPELAITDTGAVLVTWTSEDFGGDSGTDIQARTYTLDDLSTPGSSFAGDAGNNSLSGTPGDDTLMGDAGADYLDGGAGADILQGGLGNDFYIVDTRADQVQGEVAFSAGGGIDTVRAFVTYSQPENIELVRLGNLTDTDNLNATGNDAPGTLVGNAGANVLVGRGGNDQINGNNGDDWLVGNTGVDTLVGGNGSDTFVYLAYADSRAGAASRDVINGFTRTAGQDDVIDLSAMDANTTTFGVDDAFTFIGGRAFGGTAGELRYQGLGGPNAVIVEGDHNGDAVADFQIFINLTTYMTGSDFIL